MNKSDRRRYKAMAKQVRQRGRTILSFRHVLLGKELVNVILRTADGLEVELPRALLTHCAHTTDGMVMKFIAVSEPIKEV